MFKSYPFHKHLNTNIIMDFSEALLKLKEGRRINRPAHDNEWESTVLELHYDRIVRLSIRKDNGSITSMGEWKLEVYHILASDWKLFEIPKQ